MTKFKCNGCSRNTEFLWLDQADMPDGFKMYQCMDCGCVGVKNIAEQKDAPELIKITQSNTLLYNSKTAIFSVISGISSQFLKIPRFKRFASSLVNQYG